MSISSQYGMRPHILVNVMGCIHPKGQEPHASLASEDNADALLQSQCPLSCIAKIQVHSDRRNYKRLAEALDKHYCLKSLLDKCGCINQKITLLLSSFLQPQRFVAQ